jgi:V/A-type H+-transporting ATPase subunit I
MTMLRPVPMVHLRAQIPNRDAAVATRAIASEGLLHLVDIAHGRAPYDAAPPGVRDLYASFRDLVQRIRAVADRLGIAQSDVAGAIEATDITDFAAERERILITLEPLERSTVELMRNASNAHERAANAREARQSAERLRRASIDVQRLLALKYASVRAAIAPPETLPQIAAMIAPAPHVIVPLDDFFIIAAPVSAASRVDEALRVAVAQPIPLQLEEKTPNVEEAETAEADAKRAIEEERAKCGGTLAEIARSAETVMLLLQAQTYFAASGRFVVISGWVPAANAEKLRARLRAATHDHAIVDLEPAESATGVAEGSLHVPILHRNPLLLRPFQKLVDLYGTASYQEVEPTAFFAVAFLLMFGLMFGDAGHGAVLFSAGWLLFRYIPRFLDYGILLMEAGTSSTIFGLLYGSFFGIRNLIPTLWLEPIDDLSRFMFIAAGFGAIVITAGLALNIANTWRTGDLRAALIGPKGLAGAMLYWVILVLIARAVVGSSVRIPAWIIIALLGGVALLLILSPFIVRSAAPRPKPIVRASPWWTRALEASVELFDTLFSYFANTISFVRIAAFAAVHAGVFIAIFALAGTMAALRFGSVLAIAVHVAGNVLVILLEGLTVSVQVLRLEYYEFFGKFFRGGGEAYVPLTLHARSSRHA